MPDLDRTAWWEWVEHVAGALDVPPEAVDIDFIHSLTQVVAHEFQRPMAPVSAYILGVAAAQHPERSLKELRSAIVAVVRSDPGTA
nr:molybdopterin-guanine dinucleotide biosynthesis protein A [Propionibacterium sp.]